MFQFIDFTASKVRNQLVWPISWVIVTGIGIWLRPDTSGHGTHRQLGLPQCPSVTIFGRPCPGCGLTTSWTHLLHGHIAESFVSNAVGPLLYLAYTFMAVMATVAIVKGKYWDTNTKVFNWVASSVLAGFMVYGIIRFANTRYPGPAAADFWQAKPVSASTRH
ncbi:MAG: DUF2752 domain-containing protein [Armatimonadota bacterium]